MSPRFVSLTLDEFTDLLQRFEFTRRVDAVHMHHTWRPSHAQYRGEATIEAMWRFHTQTNGWRDIAQHVSIGPDGSIWTGRDWNLPPASAAGFNGNSMAGPFMFETIGDFDRGQDRLEGVQLAAVVGVIARMQQRFGLGADSLRFHRSMTNLKSCPGTGVDLDEMKVAVGHARTELGRGGPAARVIDAWTGPESLRGRERADEALRIWRHAGASGGGARAMDPMDAEPAESEMSEERALLVAGVTGTTRAAPDGHRGARDVGLTPEILAALRPHIVNLNQGQLSEGGLFSTSPADVDAIFEDHLARAAAEAAAGGQPLRILFWAHGGLIDEASGLRIAHLQVSWWKRNGVYPIHFVWETGFVDALKQILSGARRPGPRGVARDIWDHTTDLAVEAIARTLGGGKIWSAMKRSAELAAADDGGATYVAERLRTFCQAPPCPVELHAVGHSAGSIFHAHFLPVALRLGAPSVKTLQLLAPAIRVDTFKSQLLSHVGAAVQSLTMFTMKRDWEEGDHVAQVYRKSLLYLVHHALERDRTTPILGLEASLRDDRELVALFGLGGPRSPHEVVWSVSEATTGPSASTARSHGGFDNDRATMDAVATRILGAPPAVTFPDEAVGRGLDLWSGPPVLPHALAPFFTSPGAGDAPAPGTAPWAVSPGAWGAPAGAPPARTPAAGSPVAPGPAAPGGRRRALCVGIDRYLTMPLAGCVADARDWAQSLDALGFETALLLDEAATRTRILDDLRALLAGSRPGDVLAFQFAGHGTELPDLDGDEVDGSNGSKDEALCPYDIAQGAFVIDDDLADVFAALPDGVNLTCFIDCCHSGTVTRVMVGPAGDGDGHDRRARFLPATPEMEAAHHRFRERIGGTRTAPPRSAAAMRQVVFSACRDYEVAFETSGHGDFTVRATRILDGGIAGVTHEAFQERVNAAFGAGARQHPELDCAPGAGVHVLLAPLAAGAVPPPAGADGRGGPMAAGTGAGGPSAASLAQALRTLANALAPAP
ncbi:MAG TPA: caspase family protein [Candidatus Binatia bacterium]|nr:caspase family protein [Candidatus Binatia bacterium]